jgi:NADPH:quinone reductase-like Zn-dependent oxidoreductase
VGWCAQDLEKLNNCRRSDGDIKKRQDSFGLAMPYPRVIPHSDGAGQVDQVGEGVSPEWVGRRVWCYGAQSYRPFGTATEFTVVPLDHVPPLPENVSPEEGACLGIPGITAHRSVHVGGDVISTVRPSSEEPTARAAGAHEVVLNDQGW